MTITTSLRTLGRKAFTSAAVMMSAGVASALVVATVPAPPEPSPTVRLTSDSTALILGGTTVPEWRDADIDLIMEQFIAPVHPGAIDAVSVRTPQQFWPVSGILRLLEFAFGDPRVAGPGGAAWPDQPWWKLSGLFDLTARRSLEVGAENLQDAITANPSEHQVIFGYSQGAGVANVVKRQLAAQYPDGTAPNIDFVLGGDPNLPNGGLMSRFAGLYIPILDMPFNGPAPTDTEFDTIEINRQYDGFVDFPLYPLNLVATLNAVMGIVFLHTWPFDMSLAPEASEPLILQGTHGDTTYYFLPERDLPLFAPLRLLGVPERLIDVFEPVLRVLVELGYDRTIGPWQPTPARLIPRLNPAQLVTDLAAAVGEGVDNALGLVGLPPLQKAPAADVDSFPRPALQSMVAAPEPATVTDEVTETVPITVVEAGASDVESQGKRNEVSEDNQIPGEEPADGRSTEETEETEQAEQAEDAADAGEPEESGATESEQHAGVHSESASPRVDDEAGAEDAA